MAGGHVAVPALPVARGADPRRERLEFRVSDVGKGLVSLGCLIMLVPVFVVLLFVVFAALGALFGAS